MRQNITKKLLEDYHRLVLGLAKYNQVAAHYKPNYSGKLLSQEQSYNLYIYGQDSGAPILCIPSLINRAYLLDLEPNNSFMQTISAAGFSGYLIDWRNVDHLTTTINCNLNDYVQRILVPLIKDLVNKHQQPLILMGYCFGGILAALVAKHLGEKYIKLVSMLATPWNFAVKPFNQMACVKYELWQQIFTHVSYIPAIVLQALFYWQDVFHICNKFQKIGCGELNVDNFIHVENWANDGINMSKNLFFDCLSKFIYSNTLLSEEFALKMPVLCIAAKADKIVPQASSLAVQASIPHAKIITVEGGHLAPLYTCKNGFLFHLQEMLAMKV